MDTSNNIENKTTVGSAVALVLAVFLSVAHFVFIMRYYEPAYFTRDANAYYAQARFIATEGTTSFSTESLLQYVDRNWMPAADGRYYSRFPPGFPAILAVAYRMFGVQGALLVNPLLASLTLLAVFMLGRLIIGPWWGLSGAALMALNPVANEQAFFAGSHTITAFFLVAGLYCILKWSQTRTLPWVFAAGALLGIIPSFRYVESLFVFAAGLFILLHFSRKDGLRRTFVDLMVFAAGVALFVVPLAIRHQLLFGAPWKTGYAISGEQFQIGLQYFRINALTHVEQLLSDGVAYAFVLGVIGLVYLCSRRETWKKGVLFAAVAAFQLAVYMSYYFTPYAHSPRMFLPAIVVFIIGTISLLASLTENRRAAAVAVSVTVIFLTACWGIPRTIFALELMQYNDHAISTVTDMLEDSVEPESIVLVDEDIARFLFFVGKWRLAESQALFLKGRPQKIPSVYNYKKILPGKATEQFERYASLDGPELFSAFEEDVWDWAQRNNQDRVYWLARERQLDRYMRPIKRKGMLRQIAKVEVYDRKLSGKDLHSIVLQPTTTEYVINWITSRQSYLFSKSPFVLYEWTLKE